MTMIKIILVCLLCLTYSEETRIILLQQGLTYGLPQETKAYHSSNELSTLRVRLHIKRFIIMQQSKIGFRLPNKSVEKTVSLADFKHNLFFQELFKSFQEFVYREVGNNRDAIVHFSHQVQIARDTYGIEKEELLNLIKAELV